MSVIRVRRINDNHDSEYGSNRLSFDEDLDAVVQAVQTKLQLFTGEWWEDTLDGTPMLTAILGHSAGGSNRRNIDRLLQKRLSEVPYVTDVTDVLSSFNKSTRNYTFQCTLVTDFGTISVSNNGAPIHPVVPVHDYVKFVNTSGVSWSDAAVIFRR